ncbi:MAG TPA: AIR synthase-related protein, partial [Candidatus Saccharimonadales bacterium]|nr:AIR synthase-related protein [Candidatus Saccharimonadales bacterium]
SGLHSNGYTLARKILLEKRGINEDIESINTELGEELLKPTAIYTSIVLKILEIFDNDVHGLAHITGGGYTKLKRLNSKVDYILDKMPSIYGIFKQIKLEGNVTIEEMYRTFNMGIGFCLIVSKDKADEVVAVLKQYKIKGKIIGNIKRNGTGETFVKTEEMIKDKLVKL